MTGGGLAKPDASQRCWNPSSSLAGFEVIRHPPKSNATKRCVVFWWAPGKESERIKHVINRTVFSASADIWQREAVGGDCRAVDASAGVPRGGLRFSLEQRTRWTRGEEVKLGCFHSHGMEEVFLVEEQCRNEGGDVEIQLSILHASIL